MKYLISVAVCSLVVLNSIFAQERYLEPVFDSIQVDTYTYSEKNSQQLDLDVYTPVLDSKDDRPVFVYVHGGGFKTGARDMPRIREFCQNVAKRGYVAVSVTYRLAMNAPGKQMDCNCPLKEKLNALNVAVEDLQDAVYFLIERREQFGIDPHRIILAGSSAGAHTVLATAFQPPYCYGLDSGPVSFAGVVAMGGAICDTASLYEDSAVPAMLFHGTDDPIVPYGPGVDINCDKNDPGYWVLYGSSAIAERLRELDKSYWLHSTCGGGHELASTPMVKYVNEIMQFAYSYVLQGEKQQKHTVVKGDKPTKNPSLNFCADENQGDNN